MPPSRLLIYICFVINGSSCKIIEYKLDSINDKVDLLIRKFDQLIDSQKLACKNYFNSRFKTFEPPRELFFTGSWQPTASLVNGLFFDANESLVYFIITETYVKFTNNLPDQPGKYIEVDKLEYFIKNQTFLFIKDWNKAQSTEIGGYFINNPLTYKEIDDLKC